MAGETYYFIFSLIAVLTAGLYLLNLLYIKTKGKTTFGIRLEPETREYKNVIELASARNIAITIVITSIVLANLVYELIRLAQMEDRTQVHDILFFAPVVATIFVVGVLTIGRKQAQSIAGLGATRKKR